MASCHRALSKSAHFLLKSTVAKPTLRPNPTSPSLLSTRSSPTFSRSFPQLGCLQSLLPLHSAVSSARLTSCLGLDSRARGRCLRICFAVQIQEFDNLQIFCVLFLAGAQCAAIRGRAVRRWWLMDQCFSSCDAPFIFS